MCNLIRGICRAGCLKYQKWVFQTARMFFANGFLLLFLSSCGVTPDRVCQDFHRVKDLGDLVKQMYEQGNNACLYQAPVEQLEQVWGVTVWDISSQEISQRKTQWYLDFNEKIQKLNKTLHNNHQSMGLLVIRDKDEYTKKIYFTIKPLDYFLKKYGTFGTNQSFLAAFPSLKAETQITREPEVHIGKEDPLSPYACLAFSAPFEANRYYIWRHPTHPNGIFIYTRCVGEPLDIKVFGMLPPTQSEFFF